MSPLPGLVHLCEYSVNKSTSAHPQSKSYQLLFSLHLFSAVKGKTKIIPPGQRVEKRGEGVNNTHTPGKGDINGYFEKEKFAIQQTF